MKKFVSLLFVLALLAACTPAEATPSEQAPSDSVGNPLGGEVYIDEAYIEVLESYPVQVFLRIQGNLPTPCHSLHYQYEIQDFGDELRLDVTAYSENDSDEACAQVLEPFDESISFDLENAAEGNYVVYLNGDQVGEFGYPG